MVLAATASGAVPSGVPTTGWNWATVATGSWIVVGLAGFLQLTFAVVRDVPSR